MDSLCVGLQDAPHSNVCMRCLTVSKDIFSKIPGLGQDELGQMVVYLVYYTTLYLYC